MTGECHDSERKEILLCKYILVYVYRNIYTELIEPSVYILQPSGPLLRLWTLGS